ncbi:hypothetical protein EQG68_11580 [Flavobacterium piscinae]|uniref:Uncharacterized protein n=1 Tax=Flavobacterium piscinae TaxID=2506424 RepID=A0A4Q1KL97_9FLAO|nr:hypothetical protein [Flavobacterium piscinae]RXR30688.1 hypothetical protein EQG68_11580 [Flavobacterium piscinae]
MKLNQKIFAICFFVSLLFYLIIFKNLFNPIKKHDTNEEIVTEGDICMIIKTVLDGSTTINNLDGNQDWYVLDELLPPEHFEISNKNNYFTDIEFKVIQKQLDERKKMKLIQDSIYPKQLLSSKVIDSIITIVDEEGSDRKNNFIKKYTQKFGDKNYIIYSLPLFSRDKKTVYIEQSDIFGGKAIYCRKENGKWKFYITKIWI